LQIEEGYRIAEGVWAGCKNYSLLIASNDGRSNEKVAIRGITRDACVELKLNFANMKRVLLGDGESVVITRNEIRRKTLGVIVTTPVTKKWRPVQSKNKPIGDGNVYAPYRYKKTQRLTLVS